jgi:tetratricopeptide (TPR) repeat protein
MTPATANDYFDLAYDCGQNGDYLCAIENYTKALELKPAWAIAYNNRGAAFEFIGKTERAIEDYRKAVQLDPDFHNAKSNLDDALKRKIKKTERIF